MREARRSPQPQIEEAPNIGVLNRGSIAEALKAQTAEAKAEAAFYKEDVAAKVEEAKTLAQALANAEAEKIALQDR